MTYPLLTPRLSIEPLKRSDLDTFVGYRQDDDVARFQSWDTTYSAEQAVELIESQAGVKLPGEGQWLQLGIHDLISGELVGDLALHLVNESQSVFELGFTIASQHQGKGFASEAASRLMSFLFLEVGAEKIVANTDRRNVRSTRLLLDLGFSFHPSKSWTENFKNEIVTVDCFECLPQTVTNR
jgi:RimJ/RimL family protein N-acetyltransferase